MEAKGGLLPAPALLQKSKGGLLPAPALLQGKRKGGVRLSKQQYFCLSVSLSLCRSVSLSLCLSVFLSLCLSPDCPVSYHMRWGLRAHSVLHSLLFAFACARACVRVLVRVRVGGRAGGRGLGSSNKTKIVKFIACKPRHVEHVVPSLPPSAAPGATPFAVCTEQDGIQQGREANSHFAVIAAE